MVPPTDLARLSRAELEGLVIQQFEIIAELQRTVAMLRDEMARLKGGPGRPNIKPSGMHKATEPKSDRPSAERPKRGPTRTKLIIHEEKTIKLLAPSGARFKGYTSYIVQDLVLRPHVVEFRCERWGDFRWHFADSSAAGRHCGALRTRIAPVYFGAISPRAGDRAATGGDARCAGDMAQAISPIRARAWRRTQSRTDRRCIPSLLRTDAFPHGQNP
jgi:hypothetical protein